jgi:hypothetical protein
VLRCDYLFGYCGDYDSGANLKATQVVADPQAFGGAYMTFARGGGQRLDYQLALCNAGWGPSNGGCTNQAYRLIVLVATKCPTCGSVVVDVKGWDHTAGNGLPDDTSAPTSYSHTVSLTTHKGVLHKQLVFVPVPLGAAANETQLTITRASGTPRIEGLWADEAP